MPFVTPVYNNHGVAQPNMIVTAFKLALPHGERASNMAEFQCSLFSAISV